MNNLDNAKKLLEWNKQHLTHSYKLKVKDIGVCFASNFTVRANGRVYHANHDSYFEFLNRFRSTIRSINYRIEELISQGAYVTIAMTAQIDRLNNIRENFSAILILKFDDLGKIILWHEVYTPSET